LVGLRNFAGDKTSGPRQELKPQPLEKYLSFAKSSGIQCKTLFVASDDTAGAVEEMRAVSDKFYPGASIKYISSPALVENLGFDNWDFRER